VFVADRAYRVPLSSDSGYVDEVLRIAQHERCGLVVPTIDDELTAFAGAARRFLAAGIRVAVSPASTTTTCHDKLATCTELIAKGVAAATTWLPEDVPRRPAFPLFVKPRFGRGGVGAFPIRDRRDLEFFVGYVEGAIVQEYLAGREFTIDMVCDWAGVPIAIVPRERIVIRAGVSDRGRTVYDPALIALAQACASALPFAGPVNIQCRLVQGRPTVFEINPRFSGGIPLTIAAGVDVPGILVALAAGAPVRPCIGRFKENLWMTNYEASVFVEERQAVLAPLGPVDVAEVA
jgi:carbamoyl-phosphate synthase large subunit